MPRAPSAARPPESGEVGGYGAAAVVAVAIALAALALYGVWAFWPSEVPPGTEALAEESVHFLAFEPTLSRDGLLFATVVFAAGLGGLPRVLRSLALSIGNREFGWRTAWSYVTSLLLGIAVASVLFLLVRLGVSASEPASPYWFASLGAVVGLLIGPARAALRAS